MNKRAANRLVWMMVAAMVASFGSVSIVRGGATKDPVTLIANNTVPVASLTEADIKSIFLGKKTTVEGSKDGKKVKIKPVIATLKGGATHDAFLKKYVGKTATQYSNYWKKLVFSGKGKEPPSFKTEKELLAFVSKTKGAIGYIGTKTAEDPKVNKDKVVVFSVSKKK